ncbi:DEAD/DEAH box helicase family protein [bacterium]|nr:DEAD/DEAH box helicase family protein [bacterium]
MNPQKYLTPPVIQAIRVHIETACDNEVYFIGHTNSEQIVDRVEVMARGHQKAVPAIIHKLRETDVVIHNHPSGNLTPSDADLNIAAQVGNKSVGFFIVNNFVDKIYVAVEPFPPQPSGKINDANLQQLLSPNGLLANHLPEFEYRPEQVEMLTAVSQAFNESKILLCEAGTGIGKTLAYLLPAIYWAKANQQPCVISTNTINLQEQLIKKDIPLLQSILPLEFSAALVKGRSNYVCLRKVEEMAPELELVAEDGEEVELDSLIDWARHTHDGSKADLSFVPRMSTWEKVCADSDTCLRSKCAFYQKCFMFSARRLATKADILVVNHHLLFADLSMRLAGNAAGVLPEFQRLIFDEAHHLEDVATHYFGAGVTYFGLFRMFSRLYRKNRKKHERGMLPLLAQRLRKENGLFSSTQVQKAQDLLHYTIMPAVSELKEHNDTLMEAIFLQVQEKQDKNNSAQKMRLTSAHQADPEWRTIILEEAQNFIQSIRFFAKDVHKLTTILEDFEKGDVTPYLSNRIEIEAQIIRLIEAANTIESVLFGNDSDNVRWVEAMKGYRSKIVRLRISPLEVSSLLCKSVFEPFKTVVLTSATLTVKGISGIAQFEYIEKRTGLEHIPTVRKIEKELPAPFDYHQQALICVPTDMPSPVQKSFAAEVVNFLPRILKPSSGGAFILFTSHSLLNLVYNQLESEIRRLGLIPLKQGSENRHQLLERFRKNKNGVLFGTDSFWEGVDVQGDALKSVIIVKLPFKVPTEPVIQARVQALEDAGENAFMTFTVPQATIKFKQGFGRLIRSKTDRGSIIILDNRIVQKRYGHIFLKSLPPCKVIKGTRDEIVANIATFFANKTS